MQGADPASLAIGTQVSAKYKGAYCEAKVKTVDKQIKVRVTLKGIHGTTGASIVVRDKDIISISGNAPLSNGVVIKIKHPDNNEEVEATVKQIQDQSKYTVIFNDGDIATLKRNALCMKSGKHFNASESLDNLPLTHPEHFSSPASVGGSGNRGANKRRHKSGNHDEDGDEDDDESSSSDEGGHDEDLVNDAYSSNIGRVVWAENTDKKTKAKDSWFLALIVDPSASDTAKIRTKKEFLIRSFKDGRYYTVSKKDTMKFRHNESPMKKNDNPTLKEAMERAITFLEKRELPPHWDRDILISHGEESTNNSTTASSESEELDDDDDEAESPEEKDHLVAELYKHMEDRGSPIDKTPSIDGKDVDLYKLYRIVDKLGGNARVTNKNLWRAVANKLGFFTTWGINQVRVHYNRFLRSFEELNRTLGCTMVSHPKTSTLTALGSSRNRQISGSSRVQMRGTSRAAQKSNVSLNADEDPVLSIGGDEPVAPQAEETATESPVVEPTVKETKRSAVKKGKREASIESMRKKQQEEVKMTTRPRRDSSSSTLAAAMQVKAQKDSIGTGGSQVAATVSPSSAKKPIVRMDRNKETENEAKKLQANSPPKPMSIKTSEESSSSDETKKKIKGPSGSAKKPGNGPPGGPRRKEDEPSASKDSKEDEEFQHLPDHVDVAVGDKIRVFYKFDNIYEAKVKRVQEKENSKWPRYFVHYQGWNARYDEWIKRAKIKENLSWTKDRVVSKDIEPAGTGDDPPVPSIEKPIVAKKIVGAPNKGSTPVAKSSPTPSKKSVAPSKDHSRAGTPSSVTSKGSRTGSPALKRQGSRTSTKKDTDSDDEDSESNSRKSSRLLKTKDAVPSPTSSDSRRSGRKRLAATAMKEESETEDVEVEKEDKHETTSIESTEDSSPAKPKRGRKAAVKPLIEDSGSEVEAGNASLTRSSSRGTPSREKQEKPPKTAASVTPKGKQPPVRSRSSRSLAALASPAVNDDEDDPYAFKEPENVVDSNAAAVEKSVTTSVSKAAKNEDKIEDKKAPVAGVKVESDSTDSSSSENETAKKNLTRTSGRSKKVASLSTTSEEDDSKVTSEEEDRPLVIKEAASISSGEVETCKPEAKVEPVAAPTEVIKPMLTKRQHEIFPHLAGIRSANKPPPPPPLPSSSSEGSISSSSTAEEPFVKSDIISTKQEPVEPEPAKKQRKTPSKPKSSELVESESDSDSGNDEGSGSSATNLISSAAKKSVFSSGKRVKRKAEDNPDEDEPLISKSTVIATRRGQDVAQKTAGGRKPAKVAKASATASSADDGDDLLDLACGETIPGSPVHPSSCSSTTPSATVGAASSSSEKLKEKDANAAASIVGSQAASTRLEMPFASVPESVQGPDASAGKALSSSSNIPATLPPALESGESHEANSRSSPSAALQASEVVNNDGSKSPGGDSSEDVDMESLKAESLDIEGSSSGEANKGRGGKRKAPATEEVGSRSPAPSRRKRRARESAGRGGRGGGRGRHGSERHQNDDTDESEEAKDSTLSAIGQLDNEALAALAQRSPKSSKYNFYPDFDTNMDSNARIAMIQQNIKNLRKAYQTVKTKLATTERQIKKIRRKEREKTDENKSTAIEASA